MKINASTPANVSSNLNLPKYKLIKLNNYDTFERTTAPSFKGSQQKIAKEIIQNPAEFGEFIGSVLATFKQKIKDVTPKFLGEIAAGAFLTTQAIAASQNNEEETTTSSISLEDIIEQTEESEVSKTLEIEDDDVIEFIPNKIDDIQQSADVLNVPDEISDIEEQKNVTADNKPEVVVENDELVTIDFPKKHGKLSKAQEELKLTISMVKVPKEYAEKLYLICKELLVKKDYIYNGEKFDNNTIIQNFINSIMEDYNNLTSTIDNYYQICSQNTDEEVHKVDNTTETKVNSAPTQTENNNQEERIQLAKESTPQETVKKKRPRINSTTLQITTTTDNNTYSTNYSPLTGIQFDEQGNFNLAETDSISYVPRENLDRIKRGFKKWYSAYQVEPNTQIHWESAYRISTRTTAHDIIRELDRINNGRVANSRAYRQLDSSNRVLIDVLVDLINNNDLFKEYFTLHGALRFIDRFINIESTDYNLEKLQKECNKKIQLLLDHLMKTATEGTQIKVDKNQPRVAAQIHLNPTLYDTDAKKIFGSSVNIVFADSKDIYKNFLIHTVYKT